MVRNGVVLAPETIAAIGRVRARHNRWRTSALWVIALTFLGILWVIR
jgi:ubiquinone biosynthesis protein